MKAAKYYIFDLYGTLIDIHTDENDPKLWEILSAFYSRFGADYSPIELKQAYYQYVNEELDKNRQQLGVQNVDIKLEKIFLRLLKEALNTHRVEFKFTANFYNTWTVITANLFRELSMKRFSVYPGVYETLDKLKNSGAKLFLLSNAQSIFTVPEIEKAKLKRYFDAIYISSDYCIAKPEPLFMKKLLSDQNLNPEDCVMVGNDVNSDMAVAISCGVKGVLLNTNGYSEQELNKMEEEGKFTIIRSGKIEEIL